MAIKLLIVDVDGTLSDGMLYYGNNGIEIKAFNVKDGAIIKPLHQLGINVVFLTGRTSEAVRRRAHDLNAVAMQGVEDKSSAFYNLLKEYNVKPEQCAYIGDDLNDYSAMKLCGFKACPADAVEEIRYICDYISPSNGGYGAVRDVCEHILVHEGRYNEFKSYYRVKSTIEREE